MALSDLEKKYGKAGVQRFRELAGPKGKAALARKTAEPSGASLQGTLKGTQPLALPQVDQPGLGQDKLSIFGELMREVTNRASREAKAGAFKDLGFEPSEVSGGTLAGIVNFINKQKTTGIKDIYESTVELLDRYQERQQELEKARQTQASKQLQLLVSSGGIADMDDESLLRLSAASGMEFDFLADIRGAKQRDIDRQGLPNLQSIKVDGSVVGTFNPETGETTYYPAPDWFRDELKQNMYKGRLPLEVSDQAIQRGWEEYVTRRKPDTVTSVSEWTSRFGVTVGMPVEEANRLIQEGVAKEKEEEKYERTGYEKTYISPKNINGIAKKAVKDFGVAEAEKYIRQGFLRVTSKGETRKIALSPEQINDILNLIRTRGPTFWQKIIPGGK